MRTEKGMALVILSDETIWEGESVEGTMLFLSMLGVHFSRLPANSV
jgi:hypothetical protein